MQLQSLNGWQKDNYDKQEVVAYVGTAKETSIYGQVAESVQYFHLKKKNKERMLETCFTGQHSLASGLVVWLMQAHKPTENVQPG